MNLPKNNLVIQHLLDHLHDAIVGLKKDGTVTFANAKAGDLLNFDVTTAAGKPMHNLFHDQDGEGTPYEWANSPIGYACRKEQLYSADTEFFASDENEFPVAYTCCPAPKIGDEETDMFLIFRDITTGKMMDNYMRNVAGNDPLTGLGGRTIYGVMLRQALARAQRQKQRVGLLYLDLDGFKGVNDTLGHDAGDELLKQVAGRLRKCVRDSDSIMRMGGDEFCVIAEDIDTSLGAIPVAERMIKSIKEPYQLDGNTVDTISVSIGIAVHPDDAWDDKDLTKKADQAMYAAKEAGKGVWKMAGSS